jgi:hypothetical protein
VKTLATDVTTTQTMVQFNKLINKARKSIYSTLVNNFKAMERCFGGLATKSNRKGMSVHIYDIDTHDVIDLTQLEPSLRQMTDGPVIGSLTLKVLSLLTESYVLDPNGFTRDFCSVKDRR